MRNQSATCNLGGQRYTLRIVEYKLKCIAIVHYKPEMVVYEFPVAHLKQTGTSAELKQTRRHDKKEISSPVYCPITQWLKKKRSDTRESCDGSNLILKRICLGQKLPLAENEATL